MDKITSDIIMKIHKAIEDALKDKKVKITVGHETGILGDDKSIYAKITFVDFGIDDTK